MGVGPTLRQVNLVKSAATLAYSGASVLADFGALLVAAGNSPSVAGIATADWTATANPPPPGQFQNLGETDFSNFLLALEAIDSVLDQPVADGNTVTVGQAFQTLAERADQVQ